MNPKDKIGSKKVSTSVVPHSSIFHLATAMMDGARKYGPYNWRKYSVQASIYLDAIERHKALWLEGQEFAEDSGVHHLAHIMGCCAILIDAQLHGKLVDDRPGPEGACGGLAAELAKLNARAAQNAAEAHFIPPITSNDLRPGDLVPCSWPTNPLSFTCGF